MSKTTKNDYLQMHFIVFVWGFTSIIGKLIDLPSPEMVFWRVLLTWIAITAILWIRKRDSIEINLTSRFWLIASGSIIGLHWILFFLAARISNISICLAGVATCSLWTAIIEPLVNRKRIALTEIVLGILVILGIGVLFVDIDEFSAGLGLFTGIAAAIAGAFFSVFNGLLIKKYPALFITQHQMLGAVLSIGIYLAGQYIWQPLTIAHFLPHTTDWFWLVLLALVCTVYPYVTSVDLMKRFTAFAMNLIINLEPIYGIILAYFIFPDTEKMTDTFYMGTSIILLSVFAHPLLGKIQRKETSIGSIT